MNGTTDGDMNGEEVDSMRERMDGIWERVNEKLRWESAARELLDKRRSVLLWKLSLSAICGVAIALLPTAGAAQSLIGLV